MKNKMMDDIENIGIMQGFLDDAAMEEDELEEEEYSDESQAARMLDRRPGSPEILMNNLRGDMRSVDARREELADLVGYEAAAETPDSVLAMLQPVLAQGGGLGALPQSGPMAQGPQPPMMPPPGGAMGGPPPGAMPPGAPPLPPGGAPPPAGGDMAALLAAGPPPGGPAPGGPPPGMMIGPDGQPIPPEGMPPINMAEGGLVQRFQYGSDEEGVTPVDEEETGGSASFYSPEMVSLAEARMRELINASPAPAVNVQEEARKREKLYQELLGDDTNMNQAQLLFSLAQKGLQFAGNVDAQGRPLRGSPVSRFATVAAEVPGEINKFISDTEKRRQTIRMAALQAAEKEAESVREGNIKQIESQRRLFGDILRNSKQGAGAVFGKGGLGPFWNIVTAPGMAQAYADGALTPDEDNMFLTASNRILADARSRTEVYKDDLGRDVSRQIPGYELPWLTDALAQRQQLDAMGGPPPAAPTPGTVPLGPEVAPSVAPATGEAAAAEPVSTEAAATGAPQRTIWEMAPNLSALQVAGAAVAQNVPGAGGFFSQAQQDQAYFESSLRELVKALQNNPRYAEGERQAIERELNLNPRVLRDADALRNSLLGIDRFLTERKTEAGQTYGNKENTPEARGQALDAIVAIENFQKKLMPVRVNSLDEVRALPPGTAFFFKNETTHRVRQ
jgi:hypothetical protein